MLISLSVRQLAIIEELDLDFAHGLTVISGETGAGKSILMDSLGLVLGERADSSMVRHGAERAQVAVEFDISNIPAAHAWLAEQELDDDSNSVTIRRTVRQNGSSSAWINGAKCGLSQLKALGDMLVDIHGQHAHQSLLKNTEQRALLDEYGQHQDVCDELADAWRDWQALSKKHQQLTQDTQDRDSRIEWLQFQLAEFSALSLAENEMQALEQEHRRLANADALLQDCEQATQALYDADTSAQSLLSAAQRNLETLANLDPLLNDALEMVTNANVQAQEAADSLRRYADSIELDPERLQQVDERLSQIHNLARKHHCDPETLLQKQQELSQELDQLEHADRDRETLDADIKAAEQRYHQLAKSLSQKRQQAADALSTSVTTAMQPLGMPNGQYRVSLEPSSPCATGLEKVVFEVAMNPGQPFQALAKVASGGELSRVSLALQVVAAKALPVPVRVFDEVDTGIGGGVAEIVGQQLQKLAQDCQVLCITHLPQVAAHGTQHWYVHKQTDGQQTQTAVTELNDPARVEELGRMLGGVALTQQSLAHAEEMFKHAQQSLR